MLHVRKVDCQGPVQNRFMKIGNMVKHMQEKCLQLFIPDRNIAIDETTIAFKGRVSFKMYNPQKPTKWGLRVYALANSTTGYVSVFEQYYGSQTTQSLIRPGLPFSSRILIHLCQQLIEAANGGGYHLFTDRFYTGYQLALELSQLKVHLTGTVQKSRKGLPSQAKKKMKLKKHEVVAFTNDNKVMFLAWQDKRQVLMLSTYHDTTTQTVNKTSKIGTTSVEKPTCIIDYTSKMEAVDRADHSCTSYNFSRKTLKWWRKMFFWLLEIAMVNSYILCNIVQSRKGSKKFTHQQYRKALIMQLVGDVRQMERKRGRPSSLDTTERFSNKQHFIGQNLEKPKDCAVCSNRKIKGERSKTSYFCKTCSRKPSLHPVDCFEKYHTIIHYNT